MQIMDVTALSNDDLQKQLIKHGMTPGPIVATTRGLYEKKLLMLMGQGPTAPPVKQNGQGDFDQYSDSDEDKQDYEKRVEPEINSRNRTCNSNHNRIKPTSNIAAFSAAGEQVEPTLSITKMVAQLERKSSISASTEDFSIQEDCHQAEGESFMLKDDVLKELFPEERVSPTGISATKRKPIKGAAGRPIQFTHEDILAKMKAREQMKVVVKNVQSQPIVPVWSKVLLILLIISVFYLVYYVMEMNEENPFSQLLDQSNMDEP
ncbi:LEM domain-containing protein 1 isoform X2 [Protopterus annectens]|uniref:LEM domain-containing protein 1 isoform X2 n=1 Tax=Protopterus annectens TaxID=7888 RepID=UPI001CFBB080|nr:LEM domain-containing protein 1 isoform X2 [Protopterus annectens]